MMTQSQYRRALAALEARQEDAQETCDEFIADAYLQLLHTGNAADDRTLTELACELAQQDLIDTLKTISRERAALPSRSALAPDPEPIPTNFMVGNIPC